jgi:hypothetical protein
MDQAETTLIDAAKHRPWWYRALHARLIEALGMIDGRVLVAGCGTGGLPATLRTRRSLRDLAGQEWSAIAVPRAAAKVGTTIARGRILLASGVQSMMLGIIGEYVGHTLLSANGKPQGTVRNVMRNAAAERTRA